MLEFLAQITEKYMDTEYSEIYDSSKNQGLDNLRQLGMYNKVLKHHLFLF